MSQSITCTSPDGRRYIRNEDGIWRYADSFKPVPDARDMTISNLYNLPVRGSYVIVPASLAHNEPLLRWCLDASIGSAAEIDHSVARGQGRDPGIPRDGMLVPLAEWDARAREVIGIWAPEIWVNNWFR